MTELVTESAVKELLREIRSSASRENPEVSGLNIRNQIIAKHNGFPLWMHHEAMDPIHVMKKEERDALIKLGYREQYKFRAFPAMLYRRNMDEKFAPIKTVESRGRFREVEDNSIMPYVETRIVANQRDADKLMKQKVAFKCGPWVTSAALLEPLPEETDVDPNLEIAELKGRLSEAQRRADERKAG